MKNECKKHTLFYVSALGNINCYTEYKLLNWRKKKNKYTRKKVPQDNKPHSHRNQLDRKRKCAMHFVCCGLVGKTAFCDRVRGAVHGCCVILFFASKICFHNFGFVLSLYCIAIGLPDEGARSSYIFQTTTIEYTVWQMYRRVIRFSFG